MASVGTERITRRGGGLGGQKERHDLLFVCLLLFRLSTYTRKTFLPPLRLVLFAAT